MGEFTLDSDTRAAIHSSLKQQSKVIVRIVGCLVILCAAALLTFPVSRLDFVQYDDNIHVFGNPYLQRFDLSQVGHFWTHPYSQLYVPMSYTVFALLTELAHQPTNFSQYTSTGALLDPRDFHLANLVLHLINAVLVFGLLRRLSKSDLPALMGSLLFALHPMQVESVAWVSELRGLLAAAFVLASIHLYLNYAEKSTGRGSIVASALYSASLFLACCANLSKPSSVMLFLLIAAFSHWACAKPWKEAGRDCLPFLLLGAAFVFVTAHVQASPRGQVVVPWLRPFVAGDALAFYLWKFVAPLHLAIVYGRTPRWVLSHWWGYVDWLFPAAIGVLACTMRRSSPYIGFGLMVAFGSLLPELGLVPFVFQHDSTTADRYAYLAFLGAGLIVCYGLAALHGRIRTFAVVVTAMWLLVLSLLSYRQTLVWKNSYTLFAHSVRIFPYDGATQNGLGKACQDRGLYVMALPHFALAVALDPLSSDYHANLGTAYMSESNLKAAQQQFRTAVELNPGNCYPRTMLGNVMIQEGQPLSGLLQLQKAVLLAPGDGYSSESLVAYYANLGRYDLAIAACDRCLRYSPNYERLWRYLGLCLCAEHKWVEAEEPLRRALSINPEDKDCRDTLQMIVAAMQQGTSAS